MEHIRFICDACGSSGKAPVRFAGQRIKCPGCQSDVELPPILKRMATASIEESDSGRDPTALAMSSGTAWNLRACCSAIFWLSIAAFALTVLWAVAMNTGREVSLTAAVFIVAGSAVWLISSLLFVFLGQCVADIHEHCRNL